MTYRLLLLTCLLLQSSVYAKHDSDHPLTPHEWTEVQERVELLNDAVFIPSLLPAVMKNQDALELTEAQLALLDKWRQENYVPMVNIMNRVIELKVQFSVESLSPEVESEHLIRMQQRIHQLQHELLMVRITCRDILIDTLSKEQWEDFEFMVADNPKIASFISQSKDIVRHGDH